MNHTLTSNNGIEADLEKIAKVGRGKRDLILIVAFVVVAGVIGAVAVGFRGNHVARSADAMTAPVPAATSPIVPRTPKP